MRYEVGTLTWEVRNVSVLYNIISEVHRSVMLSEERTVCQNDKNVTDNRLGDDLRVR